MTQVGNPLRDVHSPQAQLIDSIIFKEDPYGVFILSGALKSFAWGIMAVVIYAEFKMSLPHAISVRIFFLVSVIIGIIVDHSIIVSYLDDTIWNGPYLYISQVQFFFVVVVGVLATLGFVPKLRTNLEPTATNHLTKVCLPISHSPLTSETPLVPRPTQGRQTRLVDLDDCVLLCRRTRYFYHHVFGRNQ